MIDRDSALERVEFRETEKERLLVQISDLEVSGGPFAIRSSINALTFSDQSRGRKANTEHGYGIEARG